MAKLPASAVKDVVVTHYAPDYGQGGLVDILDQGSNPAGTAFVEKLLKGGHRNAVLLSSGAIAESGAEGVERSLADHHIRCGMPVEGLQLVAYCSTVAVDHHIFAGSGGRVEIRLDIAEAKAGGDSDIEDALAGNQRIAVLVDGVDEKVAVEGMSEAEERVSPVAGRSVGQGWPGKGCPRKECQGQKHQRAQGKLGNSGHHCHRMSGSSQILSSEHLRIRLRGPQATRKSPFSRRHLPS